MRAFVMYYLSRIRTAPNIACNELHLLDSPVLSVGKKEISSVFRNDFIFDIRSLSTTMPFSLLYSSSRPMLHSSCVFSSSRSSWISRFSENNFLNLCTKSNVNLSSIRSEVISRFKNEARSCTKIYDLVRSLLSSLTTCLSGERIGAVTPDTRVSLTHP